MRLPLGLDQAVRDEARRRGVAPGVLARVLIERGWAVERGAVADHPSRRRDHRHVPIKTVGQMAVCACGARRSSGSTEWLAPLETEPESV